MLHCLELRFVLTNVIPHFNCVLFLIFFVLSPQAFKLVGLVSEYFCKPVDFLSHRLQFKLVLAISSLSCLFVFLPSDLPLLDPSHKFFSLFPQDAHILARCAFCLSDPASVLVKIVSQGADFNVQLRRFFDLKAEDVVESLNLLHGSY
jgi:hypothetical protein